MKKKILIMLELLLAGLFIFSAYKIMVMSQKSNDSEAYYNEIRNIQNNEQIHDQVSPVEEIPYKKVLQDLKIRNEDVLGWIKIEETKVDYPFAAGIDNAYYLSHLIDKTENEYGSIFMDMRNSSDFSDRHTVLYGHNALNGTMFGSLKKYNDDAYLKEHSFITIHQENQTLVYEIFGAVEIKVTSDIYKFDFINDAAFTEFTQALCTQLNVEAELDSEDQILTLSTCTDFNDSKRFIVSAKLIEVKSNNN